MIMCVLLCYPVSIRIYYQQGGRFLVPVSNPSEKAYSVVENAKKWEIGCLFHTQVHYSLIFVDALNKG